MVQFCLILFLHGVNISRGHLEDPACESEICTTETVRQHTLFNVSAPLTSTYNAIVNKRHEILHQRHLSWLNCRAAHMSGFNLHHYPSMLPITVAVLLIHVFGNKSKSHPGVQCDVSHLCVYTHRCGAQMTDNLSTKCFPPHISVSRRRLFYHRQPRRRLCQLRNVEYYLQYL